MVMFWNAERKFWNAECKAGFGPLTRLGLIQINHGARSRSLVFEVKLNGGDYYSNILQSMICTEWWITFLNSIHQWQT